MDKNYDENYKERFIPPNFENGINILGLNFKFIFVIESIFLGVVATIGVFLTLKTMFGISDIGQIIGFSIAFGGVFAFIGIRGINDEPISTFLANLIFFAKNKRTAYYNPRVKKEAVSFTEEREKTDPMAEAIPRERILALIEELKEKHPSKLYVDDSQYNPNSMKFEEDKKLEDIIFQEEKEKRGIKRWRK